MRDIEEFLNKKIKGMELRRDSSIIRKIPWLYKRKDVESRQYRGYFYSIKNKHLYLRRKSHVTNSINENLLTITKSEKKSLLALKKKKNAQIRELRCDDQMLYFFEEDDIVYVSKQLLTSLRIEVFGTITYPSLDETFDVQQILTLMAVKGDYVTSINKTGLEEIVRDRKTKIIKKRSYNIISESVIEEGKERRYQKKNTKTNSLYIRESNSNRDFLKYVEGNMLIKRWRYYENDLMYKIIRVYFDLDTNELKKNTKEVSRLDGTKFYQSVVGGKGVKEVYVEEVSASGEKKAYKFKYE